MRFRDLAVWALLMAVIAGCAPAAVAQPTALATKRVASGLDRPLFVTHAPNDFDRVFIVEQGGRIKILNLDTGSINATPFLDLSTRTIRQGEQGLLGLAFHPDYSTNGRFFVDYTNLIGDTVVAQYVVTSDPDIADFGSEQIILPIAQPHGNHNGGWIAFGPNDGYLYISTGDGGGEGDPDNRAQDLNQLFGKILRIDVDTGTPFAIPPDNPFVGNAGARDEIWAYGLRNPWRCAFDAETGDLYIADVGQSDFEELDFQPASSAGGENYGWRCKEGDACFDAACCNNPGFTPPIHTFDHGQPFFSCSVTGGEVYRGCALPDLNGTYFFSDFCSRQIWSFRYNGSVVDFQNRTAELAPGGGLDIRTVSSFGRDAFGDLYICDLLDGEVFKIVASPDVLILDCNGNRRQDACDLLSGNSLDEDGNGVPDECEVPVPTVSTWGLLTVALLLLSAGSVVITRRNRSKLPT